jgi:hypothetical protein
MEETMSTQDYANQSAGRGRSEAGTAASYGKDAMSKASGLASETADKVKQTASDTAARVGGHVKQLLDQQVSTGATVVERVANSVKRAAEELDHDAPQLAGLVRGVADRVDGFAEDLRHRSADQLMRDASEFTRRQPALVFGLAALAGFFALRTIKIASSSVASPSIQPSHTGQDRRMSEFHGV